MRNSELITAIKQAKRIIKVFPNFDWKEELMESDLWKKLSTKEKS